MKKRKFKPGFQNPELVDMLHPERRRRRRQRIMILGCSLLCAGVLFASLATIRWIDAHQPQKVLIEHLGPWQSLGLTFDLRSKKSLRFWQPEFSLDIHAKETSTIQSIIIQPSLKSLWAGAWVIDKIIVEDAVIQSDPGMLLALFGWLQKQSPDPSGNPGDSSVRIQEIEVRNLKVVDNQKSSWAGAQIQSMDCHWQLRHCRIIPKVVWIDEEGVFEQSPFDLRWKGDGQKLSFVLSNAESSQSRLSNFRLNVDVQDRARFVSGSLNLSRYPLELWQKLSTEVSLPQLPQLNLSFNLSPGALSLGEVRGRWQGSLKNLQLQHDFLSDQNIGPFDLSWDGQLRWQILKQSLVWEPMVISWRNPVPGAAGQTKVQGSLLVSHNSTRRDATPWKFKLALQQKSQDCQAFLRAIPAGMLRPNKGFALEGQMSWTLNFNWGDQNSEPLTFDFVDKEIGCKFVQVPDVLAAQVQSPGRAISYHPHTGRAQLAALTQARNPFYVSLDSLEDHIIDAFVHSEDWRFWKHSGFDYRQIATALLRNLQAGRIVMGGSSISQQTAKNLLGNHQQDLSRKAEEVLATAYLEQNLDKRRILEIYLNIIEFGPRTFGLHKAATTYFGKAPEKLSISETIYLATLLPKPQQRYKSACKSTLSARHLNLINRKMNALITAGWHPAREVIVASELNFARHRPPLSQICDAGKHAIAPDAVRSTTSGTAPKRL